MKAVTFIFIAFVCLFACSNSPYQSADDVAELTVSFVDPKWDGKKIPKSGQCKNCGGEGLSPPLLVKNIPKDADFLVFEYKDKTMGVFHGAIRFQISKKTEFAVPSVPEQTFDLPQGVEVESEHTAPIGNPGAYMAPCGCGYNNKYTATIMAIQVETSGQKVLLGKGKIKLGRY
jgi:phosphatidylethanolamine-binding protein (PEBP) family uncharacterized protein